MFHSASKNDWDIIIIFINDTLEDWFSLYVVGTLLTYIWVENGKVI